MIINVKSSKVLMLFSLAAIFCIYFMVFDTNYGANEVVIIRILSVIGVLMYFVTLYSWKISCGEVFSLYTIFMTFAYLFLFGQCIMWAFGIHSDYEIGRHFLYSLKLGIATKHDIISTQLLTLVGLWAFHCGAILVSDKSINMHLKTKFDRRHLYYASLIAAIISFPLAIYNAIRLVKIYQVYGYGANLYNSDVIASTNNYLVLLSMMFFPAMVGLLIGSNYRKPIEYFCYAVFLIYAIVCTLGGDRGEWLYPLLLLIWLKYKTNGGYNKKQLIRIIILALAVAIVLPAISNAREYGVSFQALRDAIVTDDNPIISTFFEMGRQMDIPLVFLQTNWDVYPYGNTYFLAFLGMITERFILILINPNYISVASWLSHDYLGISYGAGFSMIAEALINYGPYLGIACLFVIGILYSSLMNTQRMDSNNDYISMFLKITTARVLLISIRNPVLTSLKTWVFSTGLLLIIMWIVSVLAQKRSLIQ